MKKQTLEDRFWKNVDIKGVEQCWEWKASLSRDGYGAFSIGRKNIRGHRMSLMLVGMQPENGQHCLHSCDNRKCCNPNHLRWGSNQENMAERTNRSVVWNTKLRESRKRLAKLIPSQVDYMLKLLKAGYSQNKCAEWYGVGRVVVQRIQRNGGYKHTKEWKQDAFSVYDIMGDDK